ncbi:hypothetical protein PGT21_017300 [Puccinia graminis f. sp. tritici]|uniref:RING-type domain-containing protein n=2 Tax=Puccinia graminis f. sp. tritici TaxID=56615 RepID=A0A5B0PA90_PUCGR|nr:hypothetical protein PGT21_017300 [Puccinia graminis f. sp. tritici]KAA1126087.1 hypothetical protein PGTUg99_021861 [Puccinia graminis f. sp. tritici]
MLLLVQSLRLIVLFGVSSLVYGSPVGDEVRSQESMSLCSICTSTIPNSQEMFKSPTCTEGHTAHKACVDPRYIEASSCPACEDAWLAEQDARLVRLFRESENSAIYRNHKMSRAYKNRSKQHPRPLIYCTIL